MRTDFYKMTNVDNWIGIPWKKPEGNKTCKNEPNDFLIVSREVNGPAGRGILGQYSQDIIFVGLRIPLEPP